MSTRFVIAKGFWLWVLNRLQCDGLTMPWKTIYLRESVATDKSLIDHEMIHIEQIERDGPVKFTVLYLYYLIRFGYWGNPYEVEAYRRSAN